MAPLQEPGNRTAGDNEQVMELHAGGSGGSAPRRSTAGGGGMDPEDSVSNVKTTHSACNLLL